MVQESLHELGQLAQTAGALVLDMVSQARHSPDPKTYAGEGKIAELRERLEAVGGGALIFDDELSPSQAYNIETMSGQRVVDRTGLILDIFAQHAHSGEGKLQVEMAQLNYYLPRLKGLGLQMSRLGGGIGTRGPGETKLETDRRRIRAKLSHLKKELERLGHSRNIQRAGRLRRQVFGATLVGYTNAGKSMLLNKLTGARALVEDQLFATLDSLTRKARLPGGKSIVISDTVGFINKLPHQLVAAFKSTLDEVRYANLLLHVVDVSSPNMEERMRVVEGVLAELGAGSIRRIVVCNKSDLLTPEVAEGLAAHPEYHVASARTGAGLGELLEAIEKVAG